MSRKTDPPETYEQYFWRVVLPGRHIGDKTLQDVHDEWDEIYRPIWKEDEQAKSDHRKLLEREVREHDQKVERLKIEIERQKDRIRRDAIKKREQEQRDEQRKAEQEQREAQRKAEKEAEQERRDPTPVFLPEPPLIPDEIRSKHIYVPGGTQRGKSTQLHNIIYHDIMQGNGVGVLDPKRDLLRLIVHSLPEYRIVDGQKRRSLTTFLSRSQNTDPAKFSRSEPGRDRARRERPHLHRHQRRRNPESSLPAFRENHQGFSPYSRYHDNGHVSFYRP